jgi:hypothetical protein
MSSDMTWLSLVVSNSLMDSNQPGGQQFYMIWYQGEAVIRDCMAHGASYEPVAGIQQGC